MPPEDDPRDDISPEEYHRGQAESECPPDEHDWHIWRNPSTPDYPAEYVCCCAKCGKEKTE